MLNDYMIGLEALLPMAISTFAVTMVMAGETAAVAQGAVFQAGHLHARSCGGSSRAGLSGSPREA
jgi:hypothetical protein